MTEVHRLEIMIIDFDGLGLQEVKKALENQRFPNDCINPRVMNAGTREVEWDDSHPLNHRDKQMGAFTELFANGTKS